MKNFISFAETFIYFKIKNKMSSFYQDLSLNSLKFNDFHTKPRGLPLLQINKLVKYLKSGLFLIFVLYNVKCLVIPQNNNKK